jgi:hypothetical protein
VGEREQDLEGAASARFAGDVDATVVLFNNAAHEREA